jgi:RNA polymerase sigma-70 factor (ECF subfamily)
MYWKPLYAWLRRRGTAAHEAEDLVQGFFGSLLERKDIASVDAARGRFRSFLLAALRNYVANQRDFDRAARRGGGRRLVSLDIASAEGELSLEPADPRPWESHDAAFDRAWAETVLARVRERLRAEYAARDREDRYERLALHLTDESPPAYARTAEMLGMSVGAVKLAVHRLRQEFRDFLRQEVAQTVRTPSDVNAEIGDLLQALQARPGQSGRAEPDFL